MFDLKLSLACYEQAGSLEFMEMAKCIRKLNRVNIKGEYKYIYIKNFA